MADTKPALKILIADDRADNITLLSRYLENEGYVCLTASDGEQALAVTRAEMPDLVLLDVNMPEKDGFEALQEIRSDPAIAHIPVIILTAARLEPMDMQYALNIGADDYVTKPFDRRELLARIRTRLRVKETEDIIRQRNRELNLLPEIGRELGGRLDINELTNLILRRTVETLGALLGHIILLTPKDQGYKSYHFSSSTSPSAQIQLPPLTDLLTQIRKTRQGVIIEDAHKDSRWQVAQDDPTRAVIIVPMFGHLGLLGLLILAHEQRGYFHLEHKLLLQAIAGQAAIAVENAQLYSGVIQEQQRKTSEFITTATHSLLNPLTKITLFSQLIPKIGPLNEKQAEYIRHIYNTVGSMEKLVQNLLELAIIDAGGLEPKQERVNVNALASEIAEEFHSVCEANEQTLQLEKSKDDPEVQGDRLRLQQAFRNLVDNAVRFTPGKGVILLSVQVDNESVILRVKDDGVGISKKELPFVFNRFYRSESDEIKDVQGNGLGLAIVKSIAEQHGGQVSVESEPGKGVCFQPPPSFDPAV